MGDFVFVVLLRLGAKTEEERLRWERLSGPAHEEDFSRGGGVVTKRQAVRLRPSVSNTLPLSEVDDAAILAESAVFQPYAHDVPR